MDDRRFSLRTLMWLTLAIALLLSSIQLHSNPDGLPWLISAYAFLWIAPSASYGYDRSNTIKGAVDAGVRGAFGCFITLIALNAILPDVE